MWFVRLGVLGAMLFACAVVQASNWGNIVVISSTMGNYAGRLCVGEGLRVADIGCPTYAPSITTAGDVSVTGNLSANKFIGDGSALTNITASSSDRITSGTTNVVATQDRSVTISTAGSQRVVIGENGSVGIGTTAPQATLQVSGSFTVSTSAQTTTPSLYVNTSGVGIGTTNPISRAAAINGVLAVQNAGVEQLVLSGGSYAFLETKSSKDLAFFISGASEVMRLKTNGNVGIGTTAPTSALQVSGSFTVSTSAQTTTPSLYVNTSGNVGIGTNNPNLSYLLSIGTASGNNQMRIEGSSGAQIHLAGGTFGQILNAAGSLYIGVQNANDIIFRTNTSYERVRVTSSGNVGIGTTAPSATLTVSGSAIVSGTIQVAGTDNETCDAGKLGTIRFNPVTGAPQICVQR